MIKLASNPFYILHATPRDGKQRLLELCDERSILGNAAECESAFSVLCNPRQRLEAEFFWFPCISDDRIYEAIASAEKADYELLKAMNPISRANVLLSNEAAYMDYRSSFHCELLRDLYSYDIQNLLSEINQDREIAGFPQIKDKEELSDFATSVKRDVLNKVFEPLQYIGDWNISGEMTRFIETYCLLDHDLMSDAVNFYRLLMSQRLDALHNGIMNLCESIQDQVNRIIEEDSIIKLNTLISEYADVNAPMLLYAQQSGHLYEETKRLINSLRALYISFNNDFRDTNKALHLAELVLSKFSMFYVVAENAPLDIQKLKEILTVGYKILYADEAKRAREKEIHEAEESAKRQAEIARQEEAEHNKEIRANANLAYSQKQIISDVVAIDMTHNHYAVAIFRDGKPEFIPNKSGAVVTPAIIAIDGENHIFFGNEAKNKVIDKEFEICRLHINQLSNSLFFTQYTPKVLYRLLFQRIKKEAENFLKARIEKVAVVVPVDFSKTNLDLISAAAKQAELDIVRFITASNAQALAYAYDQPEDEMFMLCDIGADSISIAYLDKGNGIVIPDSQSEVGFGSDRFIDTISSYVADNFCNEKNVDIKADKTAWFRLNDAIDQALHELISTESVTIDLPYITGNEHLKASLSKNEVLEIAKPLLQTILQKIKALSADADIKKLIVCGKIVNLGFIKDFLQNELRCNVVRYIKHGENCAFGAALLAGVISGKFSDLLLDLHLCGSELWPQNNEKPPAPPPQNEPAKQQAAPQSNTSYKSQQSATAHAQPQRATQTSANKYTSAGRSRKKPAIAVLLAVFLGVFGAQNWYLGHKIRALAAIIIFAAGICLILTGVTAAFAMCIAINFSWGCIDSIRIDSGYAKDSEGKYVMTDTQYKQKARL